MSHCRTVTAKGPTALALCSPRSATHPSPTFERVVFATQSPYVPTQASVTARTYCTIYLVCSGKNYIPFGSIFKDFRYSPGGFPHFRLTRRVKLLGGSENRIDPLFLQCGTHRQSWQPRYAPSDDPPGVKTVWRGLWKFYAVYDYREMFDFMVKFSALRRGLSFMPYPGT
jgi:hypothetical protein